MHNSSLYSLCDFYLLEVINSQRYYPKSFYSNHMQPHTTMKMDNDISDWGLRAIQQITKHQYCSVLDKAYPTLKDAKWLFKLATTSWYWQTESSYHSYLLTRFITLFGRYCFKRLSFELISTENSFQHKVHEAFHIYPTCVQ